MNDVFSIADRYIIDPTRNTLFDKQTNGDTTVEQRLITVLCLLANQPGELVSRDKLIKEVWNEYGGGDEALTQAVSFLRKLLNDTDKKIIETVPKKGYILHAEVTEITSQEASVEKQNTRSKPSKRTIYLVSAFSLVLIVALFIFLFVNRDKSSSPDVLKSDQMTNSKVDTSPSNSPDLRLNVDKERRDTIKSEDLK